MALHLVWMKISENRLYGYALRFGKDDVDVKSGTSLDTDSNHFSS